MHLIHTYYTWLRKGEQILLNILKVLRYHKNIFIIINIFLFIHNLKLVDP